jgi:hypothetical protein
VAGVGQQVQREPQDDPRAEDVIERALRSWRSEKNLREIGLALEKYNFAFKTFPAPAIYDKNGKPLLSWRVAILQLVDPDLYERFKRDEPWDSAHNKNLLAQMPAMYAPVGASPREPWVTYYQAFVGPHASFASGKTLKLSRFPHGTSNTLLVAEAASPVPWTKPEDLPFVPDQPLPKLGGLFGGDFHALQVAGQVSFLSKDVDRLKLRAAITRDGLESFLSDELTQVNVFGLGYLGDTERLAADKPRLLRYTAAARAAVEREKAQLVVLKGKLALEPSKARTKAAQLLLLKAARRDLQEFFDLRTARAWTEALLCGQGIPKEDPGVVDGMEAEIRRLLGAVKLRVIGRAMHTYHDSCKHLPTPAIYNKNGKALLSWRVAILPFVGLDELYQRFKFDEPWDSPHNKRLLTQMPDVYTPVGAFRTPGMTYYQAFVGPHAGFEPGKLVRLQSISDGSSNTLLVAEAAAPVPWTKPEDLPFDPHQAPPRLGGPYGGDFHALWADGRVSFLSKDVDRLMLRAAVTRNGREPFSREMMPDTNLFTLGDEGDPERLAADNARLLRYAAAARAAVERERAQTAALKAKEAKTMADSLLLEYAALLQALRLNVEAADTLRAEREQLERTLSGPRTEPMKSGR